VFGQQIVNLVQVALVYKLELENNLLLPAAVVEWMLDIHLNLLTMMLVIL
jgi:hypothetical protein